MYNIGIIDKEIGEKINEIYSKQVSRIDKYREILDKIYGLLVDLNRKSYNIGGLEELIPEINRYYYISYYGREDKIEISVLEYDIDYSIKGIRFRKYFTPYRFKIKLLNELLPYFAYKPVSHIINLIRDYCRYVSNDMITCNSMKINVQDTSIFNKKRITISLDYSDIFTNIIIKTIYGEDGELDNYIDTYISGELYISSVCGNKPEITCNNTIYHDVFKRTIGRGTEKELLYEHEYKYSSYIIGSVDKALDELTNIIIDDEIINLYSDKYRLIELVTYILLMEYA